MKIMPRLFAFVGLAVLPTFLMAAAGENATQSTTNEASVKITPYGYDYFKLRDGLENCRIKFERENKGRVVFLGGSITEGTIGIRGGAWHEIVRDYLKKRFSRTEFDFINAGMSSAGSTPHSFRFTRDVLKSGRVDLLFVEAAVNDELNGFTPVEMVRGMEGIVRQARLSNPDMDIVILYFEDYRKIPVYNAGKTPPVIECHERVADYYGVPSMDMAKEMAERERAGEFNWLRDFSGIHPNAFGSEVYGRSIFRMLDAAWKQPLTEDAKMTPCRCPEKPLDEKSYFRGRLVDIKEATPGDGWSIVQDWKPDANVKAATRKGFVNVTSLISEKPGSTLRLKFEGTAVGIFVAAGPDAGTVEYSIDGGAFASRNLYTAWSSQAHLPWAYVLNGDLTPGKHELVMKVADKADPKSTGTAVRIMHFLVN